VPPLACNVCEYGIPTSPPGKEVVVMAMGTAAILIDRTRVADPVGSITLTVKLAFPDAAGVPVIWPDAPRLNPEGSVPALTDHV
jgi:hypothetical protein